MTSKALIQFGFLLFMMSVLFVQYERLESVYGFFDVVSSTRIDIIELSSAGLCNMRFMRLTVSFRSMISIVNLTYREQLARKGSYYCVWLLCPDTQDFYSSLCMF